MIRIISTSFIVAFGCLMAGCSTYIENEASLAFEPIYPVVHVTPDSEAPTGGIFKTNGNGLFASDIRARDVGDILTVALNETFAATKAQTAASAKNDTFGVTLPTGLPNILTGGYDKNAAGLNAGTARSFAGSGTAAQSNSLTGLLTVSVTRVFDNGNMEIAGQKKLTLNNGDEYVRLTGLIRPEDISATNTVQSNRIADAEIVYVGAGEIADSSRQGWLSRTMRNVSPM
ncbi:flagellar basal body L-ring protein FlgH [SAR116 cluster bacterium]|nr:flagellar basal body L-ring protein FlgH [SAR116 cluster bacterium]